jgi:hypothetical chaperone protein
MDFGTTNSAIAVVGEDGVPQLAHYSHEGALIETFRSILFFSSEPREAGSPPAVSAGPRAIEAYLDAGGSGRLIQSLKSFLADRTFSSTTIIDRAYQLSELVSIIAVAVRKEAEEQFGDLGTRVIVGRPVRFSGASTDEDDELAERRLRIAIEHAGFSEIIFEYEPIGAAHYYGHTIDREELVLIADFGGGTSDFSLLRLHPGKSNRSAARFEIIGNDGVAVAGDAFDAKIIRHVVAPELGRDSQYRSPYGKILPGPVWLYSKLERWHQLSFLKAPNIMTRLREVQRTSLQPEKIAALIHTVQNDLGYQLFKSVERTKVELSASDNAVFEFSDEPVSITRPVTRHEFEGWIEKELHAISSCVERLLARFKIPTESVDTVFMTGGSSFVPAVRHLFESRFGRARIRSGNELTSVASGLALRAWQEDAPPR